MNGIQYFVGGGGAYGKDARTPFQRQKILADAARNTRNNNSGGGNRGDNNTNRGYVPPKKDDEENKNFIEKFFDKGKAENVITGNDFASDLKKASKYLYTQHPYAKELIEKYNLKTGDIQKLRLGMTQRGFHGMIEDVYKDVQANPKNRFSAGYTPNVAGGIGFAMDPEYVKKNFYEEGMTSSDMVNPEFNFLQEKLSQMPFFQGVNALFGSPKGQRGTYFGREELGLEGDALEQYAASIANNPELYNQMMATPRMQDYDFNEFIYGVRRDLPPPKGGIESLPAAEPGFDFITDNPYLN